MILNVSKAAVERLGEELGGIKRSLGSTWRTLPWWP